MHGLRITGRWVCLLWILLSMTISYAATPTLLPGSAQPGLVSQNYLPQKPTTPMAAPEAVSPEEKPQGFSPEAEKVKFKLTKIVLEDNHVYSSKELEKIYHDKLNKVITLAELQQIVLDITSFYRNNGYILSRAILPPQHVANGVVHIRILEGYVSRTHVVGEPGGAKYIVGEFGQKISESKPLDMKNLEYYLLLANQIPGANVKAVFEPSKKVTAAADLNLATTFQPINASISYDDYGTLYIGPHQITAMAAVNSYFRSGDTLRATYLSSTKGKQLRYLDFTYETLLGVSGLGMTLEGNQSLTQPGFVLTETDNNGRSENYFLSFQYPILLSRAKYFLIDGGLTYANASVNQFHQLLYADYIRSIHVGGVYNFSDRLNGGNNIALHLDQGLNMFGASDNPQSQTTSRPGADGIYTKLSAEISRFQPLFKSPFSIFLSGQAQTTNHPLLVFEQFAFGGSVMGRGYDPAELLGDKGLSGSAEIRWDATPVRQLKSLQFYAYYDIGKIWNIEKVIDVPQNQSAASTGFGARFLFTKFIAGNVMYTQVLTKEIASEELIGMGRAPKLYFSLVGSL